MQLVFFLKTMAELPYHLRSTQVHLPIDNEVEANVHSVGLIQFENLLLLLTNSGSVFVSGFSSLHFLTFFLSFGL
jgi:hypothetical protein